MVTFNVTQNPMEGKNVKMDDKNRLPYKMFLDDLIRENATQYPDAWSLSVQELTYSDRKLFLSYIVDIDDFIYFTSNPTREREAINDHEYAMQHEIDHRISDLYHQYNYEMRGY